jgi:hypothetical protein
LPPSRDSDQDRTQDHGSDQSRRGATFAFLDTKVDGKISTAKAYAGVKARFSRYDVSGDGFIESDEVGHAYDLPAQDPNY